MSTWNIRDTHFYSALTRIRSHLSSSRGESGVGGRKAAVAVWAHNSHVGSAAATHLERPTTKRELNIGQLVREHFPFPKSVIVGQICNNGVVCAADDWGGAHRFKKIRNGLPNSYENVLHIVAKKYTRSDNTEDVQMIFDMHDPEVKQLLLEPRLQRAIGVIYRPETERQSHYYSCSISEQFDIVVYGEKRGLFGVLLLCHFRLLCRLSMPRWAHTLTLLN